MSVPLHTVARAEEAVDVESGNSSRRQNTLTRHPAKADMFGYRLVAKVAIVFEGKLPLLTDGGGGRPAQRSAPATPLLCLYHRCDSVELWMRPIDRLARLCSTDPL